MSTLTADAEERASDKDANIIQSTTGNLMDGDLVAKGEPSATDANQGECRVSQDMQRSRDRFRRFSPIADTPPPAR